ncbi:restriction endonuclease [Myxococcota bacterium]|nr:restriction endonuclease [Myxococcota bacterium]MBU1382874.1 restriction endonuclease [Myxococcota bacterium]MBU1496680.1 restriction endonuclease [Myxococcota bacterium]
MITAVRTPLHFEDLDPARFEDLSLAILSSYRPWLDLRPYGKSGSDDGIDILGVEETEDGVNRSWYVQCKRYKKITIKQLQSAVDHAVSLNDVPDVFLFILACDVGKNNFEKIEDYAKKKGIGTLIIWGKSVLDMMLRTTRKDLLFAYFHISEHGNMRRNERQIVANVAMKKKLHELLLKKKIDYEACRYAPHLKFESSELIVHSADGTTYPDWDENAFNGWFKVELWDFYFGGIEVVGWPIDIIIFTDHKWAEIPYEHKKDQRLKDRLTPVWPLKRLPYRNIVEFDPIEDEYNGPHLYCRFAEGGSPFEGSRYVLRGDEYPWDQEIRDEDKISIEEAFKLLESE